MKTQLTADQAVMTLREATYFSMSDYKFSGGAKHDAGGDVLFSRMYNNEHRNVASAA
jgi:hypothetical protein